MIGSDALILDWPRSQVSAKSTSLAVAISEECLTSSSQFGGMVPASMYSTVLKSSSKTTWYCGLTRPVVGFHTKATLPAWKGGCPRYTPMRDRGSHFGGPAPPLFCSLLSRTYVGQNNV